MKQLEWDIYFLRIAREVSKNTKCLSRKIGAVLVKDNSIISTGYNGPARGMKHCDERNIAFYNALKPETPYEYNEPESFPDICPRRIYNYKSGEGLHLCRAGNAERNALIQAGRNGISTKDTILYCYCGQVCKDCAIEIINAGVDTIVFLEGKAYDNYSSVILEESKIKIRRVKEELL